MRLKVALVIDKFDPKMGGAERYAGDLALRLVREGHEVHVFCRRGRSDLDTVTIHRISCLPYPKFIRLLSFVRRARRMIAADSFHVVHALGYNPWVTVLATHTGIEESWIEGDERSYESAAARVFSRIRRVLSPREYLIRRLQRLQYRDPNVRAIMAISDMVKDDIVRYHGVDPDRITVVYNGIDTARFSPENRKKHRDRIRGEMGLQPEELLMLSVTNNYRLKGVFPAIRAIRALKEVVTVPVRLLIVGRGNPKKYIKEARRLGVADRVTFLDYAADLAPLYAAADIFLLPTFYDSCSLVVIEAMASGLPVVTTKKNGASGLISSAVSGRVIDNPRDAKAVADALASYASPMARETALKAARERLPELSDEKSFSRIIAIYRAVAAGGAGVTGRSGSGTVA